METLRYLAAMARWRRDHDSTVDYDRLPLGRVDDGRIARLLKVTAAAVRAEREIRGIAEAHRVRRRLALEEAVLRALHPREARTPAEIWREVLDDYGKVTEEQVRRVLKRVGVAGRARMIGNAWLSTSRGRQWA